MAKHNLLRGCSSELFFWRTRAQSEVDLVVKTGERMRAFEIKWGARRSGCRAFTSKYGVDVELLTPDKPLLGSVVEKEE